MKKEDDVQLIYRILSGDAAAFRVLVEKHQKGVHALVWRKIGDFHYAEEITQDTFLRAYKKLSTLKDPNQFTGWLYVIANRLCIDWLRKQKFIPQSLEDTPMEEINKVSYAHHISEQRQMETTEHRREIVKKLLAKLPESERTVVTLYYLGEMTTKEIGKFLGVSVDTIKTRLRRGRKRLQEQQIEPLVSETLGTIPFPAHITERIMQQVADIGPIQPPVGKPLLPWVVFGTAVVVVMSMLGVSNQYLTRFQKPYSFEAASEPTIEIIDAFIVLDIAAKPSVRNQGGRVNTRQESRGAGTQVSDTTPASLTSGDPLTFARAAELRIEKTITQADGLASDTVLTIFEDSQGVIWFGTINGVTRYTQGSFQTFTMEDGLASDAVGIIFEDQQGALWFGTGSPNLWSGGVSRYDGSMFQTFSTANGLPDNNIRDIFQDKTGTIWFATGHGVSRYDGQKFNNSLIVGGPMGMGVLPEWWNDVRAISQDTAGNFWFATDAGLSSYNVQTSQFRYFGVGEELTTFQEMGNARSAHLTDLLFDDKGNLWIGQEQSWGKNSGIRRYDGNKLFIFPLSQEFPMNGIHSVMQDSKGNLWFAGTNKQPAMPHENGAGMNASQRNTEAGVSVYNGNTFQNFNIASGLPSGSIRLVFETSDGKLWFATDKGVGTGVYVPVPDKEN